MKTISDFFRCTVLLLIVTASYGQATEIVAIVNGGNWSSHQTWNLNRTPLDGDVVVIPNGITLNVTNNEYNSVPSRPILTIKVRGTLALTSGSGQLNLKCGSKLCTFDNGIILSSGCNCNQIAIGTGEAVWKGSYPSVSGGDCIEACGSTLPLNLISFNAKSINQTVMLLWQTSSEVNFNSFIIERSSDGLHFNPLSTINSNEGNYSYIDQNPISGISYYRLKQVDKDNSYTYSSVISVETSPSILFTLSPNPSTNGNFKVNLSADANIYEDISMYDMVGNVIAINIIINNDYTISIEYPSNIKKGIYTVVLMESNRISTQKIMLQ